VLWRLLQVWCARHPPGEIEAAVAAVLKHPGLPPHLPPMPSTPCRMRRGVYLFFGLNEHPIYIRKSVDVRARVASPSTRAPHAARPAAVAGDPPARVGRDRRRVRCAAARSELVKTRLPAHNVALRRRENQVIIDSTSTGTGHSPSCFLPL